MHANPNSLDLSVCEISTFIWVTWAKDTNQEYTTSEK